MVFVLSKDKTPLAPTREAKARKLLKQGKAVVDRMFPFTIRLKENKECKKNFEIKFDVGASVTGIQSARTYTLKELAKDFEVTTGEGWETYANRKEVKLAKQHYYDALCIGDNYKYKIVTNRVLEVKAQGRGSRQMCRMDRFGFPRTKAKESKIVKGFQTGDIVKAIVTKGKKIGTYLGKVAVRVSGNFNITTTLSTTQGINHRYCKIIQKGDGYAYRYSNI